MLCPIGIAQVAPRSRFAVGVAAGTVVADALRGCACTPRPEAVPAVHGLLFLLPGLADKAAARLGHASAVVGAVTALIARALDRRADPRLARSPRLGLCHASACGRRMARGEKGEECALENVTVIHGIDIVRDIVVWYCSRLSRARKKEP